MKIALIGTHGVGKTTLAYDICALLKKASQNVDLVTEVARRNPFPINEATTLESQLWILHTQIADELAAAQRAPYVICDRSVLDNYCYLVNKCGRQPHLEKWLEQWLQSYGLLVGVPMVRESIYSEGFRQPSLADGLRATDRAFQQRIDALIKELLTEAPFEHFADRVLWLDGVRQSHKARRRAERAGGSLPGLTPRAEVSAAARQHQTLNCGTAPRARLLLPVVHPQAILIAAGDSVGSTVVGHRCALSCYRLP
jgi:thymidylate kinase